MTDPLRVAWFIGDEISAVGYRLAGAQVFTPTKDELLETLDRAEREAHFLVVTAETAQRIPPRRLQQLRASKVTLLVVPDVQNRMPMPDLAARVRLQLGVTS